MKRIIYIFVLLAFAITINGQVKFAFNEGIDNTSMKSSVENNISKLLTEMNDAEKDKRVLNLNGINMTTTAKERLSNLWNYIHLKCEWKSNVQNCLKDFAGYEVRGIPVQVIPLDNTYKGQLHNELTISFCDSGIINGVRMSLDDKIYQDQIIGFNENDIKIRRELVKFVEDLRSYYYEKNISAIDKIFSEKSLMTGRKNPLTQQNRKQYIRNLGQIFRNNIYINVEFSDIRIMFHPAKNNFYGLRLRQTITNKSYSDDGYLFMFWDFNDKKNPRIQTVVWIPYNENLTEEDLPKPTDFEF